MKYKRYTSSDLRNAISKSKSWREVCLNMNSGDKPGSQSNFKKRADREGIKYNHFPGKTHLKGTKSSKYVNVKDYLKRKFISSHILKLKLLKENYLVAECNYCKITTWNNNDVVWELDHIDSNHYNNKLNNLQILCPNCHSQKTRKDRE